MTVAAPAATMLSRWPLLAFGLLAMFLSNFGQSFFIALFAPDIRAEFELSSTQFGAAYSAVTLVSGMLMLYMGGLFDRTRLKRFTLLSCALVLAGSLLLGFGTGLAVMIAGLFLVRFSGQGLLGMTSAITMSRYFVRNRGKALGIATLGAPLGELVMPVTVVALIGAYGWRTPWLVIAVSMIVAAVALVYLLGDERRTLHQEVDTTGLFAAEREWTRREVLGDGRFYLFLSITLIGPFVLTGLFIHQAELALEKGWTLAWIAQAMMAYAVGHALGILGGGLLVDRFTGRRLLPYFALPFALGLLFLGLSSALWVAMAYLFLAGLSMGMTRSIGNAAVAELYGTVHLGAIRSVSTSAFVIGTAIAPVIFGLAVDSPRTNLTEAALLSSVVTFGGSLLMFLLRGRYRRAPEAMNVG